MNPIYVRQYDTSGIRNSITLLDPNGNTLFPNTVTANRIVASNFTGSLKGNSDTATKLATARNIALSGDLTGNANFDGSSNISINASLKLIDEDGNASFDGVVSANSFSGNSTSSTKL
jgi:hypothetical protein